MKINYIVDNQEIQDTLGIKLQDLTVGNSIKVEQESNQHFPVGDFKIKSITHVFGTYSKNNWGSPLVTVILERQ